LSEFLWPVILNLEAIKQNCLQNMQLQLKTFYLINFTLHIGISEKI
jgi:hypothetical protein